MASDMTGYLKELQAALAGSDPALVQDALFDAEEHLQAELAAGRAFEDIVDHYGTPAEVAAAYVETAEPVQPGTGAAASAAVATPDANADVQAAGVAGQNAEGAALGAGGSGAPLAAAGVPPVAFPARPGMGASVPQAPSSAWRDVFGVFIDGQVWKSLLYMLLSLGTGITYFTVVVTMVSTSLGTSILLIGLPLLLLTLAFIRGMALAEGRLVEALLGTRMPRRPRSEFPGSFFQRLWFWLKDGRTWASLVYLVLMLPVGIVYFTFAVTGLATGLALIAAPFVQLGWGRSWTDYSFTVDGVTHVWSGLPVWSMPFSVIIGFLILLGWFHAFRWIGRGHAYYAKAMLVRLAR